MKQEPNLNKIFSALREGYRKLFGIAELEASLRLKWLFCILLVTFFVSFNEWHVNNTLTLETAQAGRYICWPFFQDCGKLYLLKGVTGYDSSVFYGTFLIMMGVIVHSVYHNRWTLAHFLMIPMLVWKVFVMSFLSMPLATPFDYYDVTLAFVLLILPNKLFFLRLAFVVLYFLAATLKLNDGWILGTLFSNVEVGLPLFPFEAIPLATLTVTLMETVGAWFLLSSNRYLKGIALCFFITFHLYSTMMVNYRYPTSCLPQLLVLFSPILPPETSTLPVKRNAIGGWLLLLLLFGLQAIPFLIPGDERRTLEGRRIGLWMYDANHQCTYKETAHYRNGTQESHIYDSPNYSHRCDPYDTWVSFQQRCKRNPQLARIAWQLDVSINGGPFYRMVDVEDACKIPYKPFIHNSWIRLPEEGAPIVGYPVQNINATRTTIYERK